MVQASLFSGIGGFDLASEWAGWKNAFHCEINTFGRKILNYYWPNAISYDDITKTDFTIWRGRIDVLTGGFPCQPFSLAGKRLGTADHRNLWPEYHRAIREIQPTWVVGENVPGLLNWSGGLVFEQVQADLENEGYEVWPVILPACSVGAPHRRDRVWFVAYNKNFKRGRDNCRCRGLCISESVEMENTQRLCCEKYTNRKWAQESFNAQSDNECSTRGRGRSYQSEQVGQQETKFTYSEPLGKQPQQAEGDWSTQAEREEQVVCTNIREQCENPSWMLRHKRRCNKCKNYCRKTSGPTPKPRLFGQTFGQIEAMGVEQFREKQFTSNPRNTRPQRCKINRSTKESREKSHEQPTRFFCTDWQNFPTQPPICGRNDGFPARLDGITFSKWRNESIKAYGNAIVPQVAYQIFKAINEYEKIQN